MRKLASDCVGDICLFYAGGGGGICIRKSKLLVTDIKAL